MNVRTQLACLCLVAAAVACRPKAQPKAEPEASSPPPAAVEAKSSGAENSTFTSKGRVVAIGDVHGDFAALQASLSLAGIVDAEGHWSGGDATLVQAGDLLDRGDDERKIMEFFEQLTTEAHAAGGEVVSLNGNHEVMNVAGDMRYVTPGGFAEFADVKGLDLGAPALQKVPEMARARVAAFMPGGPYATVLAAKRVIAIVDDSVFVHGGVLEHHVGYGIDAINAQTAEWMRGERDAPLIMSGDDAPIWTRAFSQATTDCALLQKSLDLLRVKRMVVGHTPQLNGITSDCDGKIWRIDVGMAAHYGGKPAALEITKDGVRALAE